MEIDKTKFKYTVENLKILNSLTPFQKDFFLELVALDEKCYIELKNDFIEHIQGKYPDTTIKVLKKTICELEKLDLMRGSCESELHMDSFRNYNPLKISLNPTFLKIADETLITVYPLLSRRSLPERLEHSDKLALELLKFKTRIVQRSFDAYFIKKFYNFNLLSRLNETDLRLLGYIHRVANNFIFQGFDLRVWECTEDKLLSFRARNLDLDDTDIEKSLLKLEELRLVKGMYSKSFYEEDKSFARDRFIPELFTVNPSFFSPFSLNTKAYQKEKAKKDALLKEAINEYNKLSDMTFRDRLEHKKTLEASRQKIIKQHPDEHPTFQVDTSKKISEWHYKVVFDLSTIIDYMKANSMIFDPENDREAESTFVFYAINFFLGADSDCPELLKHYRKIKSFFSKEIFLDTAKGLTKIYSYSKNTLVEYFKEFLEDNPELIEQLKAIIPTKMKVLMLDKANSKPTLAWV